MDHRKLEKKQKLKQDLIFYALGIIILIVGLGIVLPRMGN